MWRNWLPESKTNAAFIGGLLGGVIVWALNTFVFYTVPIPQGWIDPVLDVAVPALAAIIAAWLAPHTPRPDAPVPHVHPGLGEAVAVRYGLAGAGTRMDTGPALGPPSVAGPPVVPPEELPPHPPGAAP